MKRLGSQLVGLQFIIQHLRGELKNFDVLSQDTYLLYQLHQVSLEVG